MKRSRPVPSDVVAGALLPDEVLSWSWRERLSRSPSLSKSSEKFCPSQTSNWNLKWVYKLQASLSCKWWVRLHRTGSSPPRSQNERTAWESSFRKGSKKTHPVNSIQKMQNDCAQAWHQSVSTCLVGCSPQNCPTPFVEAPLWDPQFYFLSRWWSRGWASGLGETMQPQTWDQTPGGTSSLEHPARQTWEDTRRPSLQCFISLTPIISVSPTGKAVRSKGVAWKLPCRKKKIFFPLKKKKTFCFLTEVKENDCNLNMKELFTIKSTILHIYLHHVSVKNHQLLQNTKNYMTEETKNLIKNISRYEKYCCLGVFTSSSSVYLYTTLKRKKWTNWKKLLLSIITASFNGTQTSAWYLCKFQSNLQTTQ